MVNGSLLKDLNLLKCRQKVKTDKTLNWHKSGSELHRAAYKLEKWREHFAQVNNVSVKLEEKLVYAVLGLAHVAPLGFI